MVRALGNPGLRDRMRLMGLMCSGLISPISLIGPIDAQRPPHLIPECVAMPYLRAPS